MQNNKHVSIVIPCYNEEKRFPVSYWNGLISTTVDVKWIFIDDGSTDSTLRILKELSKSDNVEVVVSEKNVGKGNAVRLGLLKSLSSPWRPQIVGYLDSDGAFSEYDVVRMIDLAREAKPNVKSEFFDAYILSRVALSGRAIQRKISRHYLGRVVATLLSHGWKGSPYDTQSGFKLFRNSECLHASLQDRFNTRWFFDVELICRMGMKNERALEIWEEPATSWIDIEGSKLRYGQFLLILQELIQARIRVNQLRKKLN